MQKIDPAVFKLRNGKYKAAFWGQHPDHISNWRGCNFRYMIIKGQPKKGFDTSEDAARFAESLPDLQWENERKRAHHVIGTFLGDRPEDPEVLQSIRRPLYEVHNQNR